MALRVTSSLQRQRSLSFLCLYRINFKLAETDGNRTRQTEMLGLTGFEDRGAHQEP